MLNEILMIIAGLVFVSFWAFLAWDAHKELREHEND